MKRFILGFSLLELIIVISIALLFSGLLLAQYGNFIEQSRLKSEANRLKNILELAKKKTIARDITGSCVSGFNGYEINAVSSSRYDLVSCCGTCDETNPLNQFNLSAQTTTISIISTTPTTIQFIPTPAGILFDNDPTITSKTIRLKNSAIPSSNTCLDITVSKPGIIDVSDSFNNCS